MQNRKGSLATIEAAPATPHQRLAAEQLRIHFKQLPAMIIAPSLGGLFSAWVLWEAVEQYYLVVGMSAILGISALRVLLYRWYFSSPIDQQLNKKWKFFAIGGALISGIIWGSAAIFLYPPLLPEYSVYLLVLLALVPVAPVATLAVYLPSFFAYYLPALLPYIFTLATQESQPERLTALLLVMMMGATITFALEYAKTLKETLRLRLKLAEKTTALEHTAQVKNQFLAAANHDLRQPVHAAGLFAEALRPLLSTPEKRNLLGQMESSLQGMRGMLDEMLDISRLDAEVVSAKAHPFRARDLLQQLADEYTPQAQQKGLRFHTHIRDIVIDSDPMLLERVLRNLLSNAIKYTTCGGILLACRPRGNRALIQIFDTGHGVPFDKQEEIFLEYTQLQNPGRDRNQGLGLGLAITARLARLLGHEIKLGSKLGHGVITPTNN